MEARVRILRGLKVMFDGKRRPVQMLDGSNPPSRIISGGVIQLGDLAPDDYTLEVTVIDILRKKDSQRVVRQEIDFSVE